MNLKLHRDLRLAGAALVALAIPLIASPASSASVAAPRRPLHAHAGATSIQPPVATGRLTITGTERDGAVVTAAGLSWKPGHLPAADRLLSFEVASYWWSCSPATGHCVRAPDSTATPFAAERYVVGHGDTGRRLRVREVATEVVETQASNFSQGPISSSQAAEASTLVVPYPLGRPPSTEFVDGTPEATTGSRTESFSVDRPHFNTTDGTPAVDYQLDRHGWRPMPESDVFFTGELALGSHEVRVRTADDAGSSVMAFHWKVVPLPAPVACAPRPDQACWSPPHVNSAGKPMRWDWQIGVVTPVERSGSRAVDLYDVDGFLTTAAEVHAMHTTWQAATLPHPKVACYLDAAWENYRPDASTTSYGGLFPGTTLGNVYYGFPEERWVDFRQLSELKPMLEERISMCAKKGFDAVEIDDIDSFDPPSTTGFHLTPGDAQNFLAFTFNLVHLHGMAALWKNSPLLSWWGRRYTDGAVVEECYVGHACFASQMAGQRNYGIRCSALTGATPCGWDDFTVEGKWVGEAEYLQDDYVCPPGDTTCDAKAHHSSFAAFCKAVYEPANGFSAALFTVDLNAKVFYPCPTGT